MFQDLRFDISFADALLLMPRFAPTINSLLMNKEKLLELAKIPLNENCLAMLLKTLPKKLGDPGKFFIPCDFPRMDRKIRLTPLERKKVNEELRKFVGGRLYEGDLRLHQKNHMILSYDVLIIQGAMHNSLSSPQPTQWSGKNLFQNLMEIHSFLSTFSLRIINIRVLRIILVILPEHQSDTQVITVKIEILLEPTSNKLMVVKTLTGSLLSCCSVFEDASDNGEHAEYYEE
ncbi:hypothetical protein Tco_1440092 [Tanacetum coccineum]